MIAVTRAVGTKAVGLGTMVTLAVAVPAALLAQTLDETGSVDDDSPWLIALFAVVLGAMVLGGYLAAERRADAPLINSALAAVGAYVVVQVIAAIRLLVDGDAISWAAMPFFALLASAAGMVGGLVADHRARTPRR
ncbi:MAG: hypothetical protein U5K30_01410 [Acidimicrobiales bacterium]|nr:hypothetical protein [Acidimicrobiales bacterium]